MSINPRAAALMAGGAVFVYSGLSGFSILKAVQNVINGQPPNAGQSEAVLAAGVPSAPGGNESISPGASAAKRWAKAHLSDFGWGPDQWSALDTLWTGESGWNYKATNKDSGAYGIPQALPGAKMASAGADWETNPVTQMKWGMGYIKGRYGTPKAALAFWEAQSPHWY